MQNRWSCVTELVLLLLDNHVSAEKCFENLRWGSWGKNTQLRVSKQNESECCLQYELFQPKSNTADPKVLGSIASSSAHETLS